ncbi:calponin [Exophiala oligosperma]
MASVTSLDQDMRKLRLDRYTPGAAKEVRAWIEDTLGERLPPGDLMDALKDGVALCKLVNLAVAPGVKYKQSNMPFVQMENISHFLRACELPPLNLPSHDRFLTVDLYDGKDPAQVLQCISAFSRAANGINPGAFPSTLGAKSKGAAMSPQGTGSSGPRSPAYTTTTAARPRGTSNATVDSPSYTFNPLNKAAYSGRISPTKNTLGRGGLATGGPVSTWSSKSDEGKTAPAWNIHQYGYMGGASQGNQGVAFGARRQITSPAPSVPSAAEKEKRLREEAERKRREAEEQERQQQAQRAAEEEQARLEEERRWAEETQRVREQELEEQRAQERERLQEEDRVRQEEQRRRERAYELEREREAADQAEREARSAAERSRQRATSDARLNGQFLSQYQADQARVSAAASHKQHIIEQESTESRRIAELERQLEELKAQQHHHPTEPSPPPRLQAEQPRQPPLPSRSNVGTTSHEDDWDASERDYLRREWQRTQDLEQDTTSPPAKPPRPEPVPAPSTTSTRPLPDPMTYTPGTNRTDRYLASHAAPAQPPASSHRPQDYSTTTEVDLETQRRMQSQARTKAGGWASKSLLEREMERERERQREWEEGQKDTAARARDIREGSAPGQSWDVHQYGYMGGDNQNRGGTGLGVGGARRQIIGPRPPP